MPNSGQSHGRIHILHVFASEFHGPRRLNNRSNDFELPRSRHWERDGHCGFNRLLELWRISERDFWRKHFREHLVRSVLWRKFGETQQGELQGRLRSQAPRYMELDDKRDLFWCLQRRNSTGRTHFRKLCNRKSCERRVQRREQPEAAEIGRKHVPEHEVPAELAGYRQSHKDLENVPGSSGKSSHHFHASQAIQFSTKLVHHSHIWWRLESILLSTDTWSTDQNCIQTMIP